MMPFDGVVTKATVEELQKHITLGRISKIYQPTDTEIVFTIRNNRKNYSFVLSIHPSYARFHLTESTYQNPDEPPMFCMVLRKHILGSTIELIEQDGLERIVSITLNTRNEIGDASTKTLVLELMGKHSNIILLNETKEQIIDSLKHVPPYQNRYRSILPGIEYRRPPIQNKLNPLHIDAFDFIKQLDFNAGKIDKQIVEALDGISPILAKEIVYRAHLGSEKTYMEKFSEIQKLILKRKYTPIIYTNDKEDFHVLPLTSIHGENKSFESTNTMLDYFYTGKADRDRVKQQAKDLYRFLKNERDKNKRKLSIHEKTIKKAKKAQTYQKLGELLTANMHLVNHGDTNINVIDYYDPDQKQITIELQPNKTPSENAQAFFKKYRKLTTSKQIVEIEIKKTTEEITYLEQLLQHLEHARDEDIEEIREELRDGGYLKRKKQKKKRKHVRITPEKFYATDGTTIYVGKNNKQNEYVTHRLAHRDDVWLHAVDIPGSHVVIRSKEPSEATLLEAALLAAYYSKAQQSASVPIDYTKIRHVKKAKGAKPGFVTYDQQKTIYVTPSKQAIERLKNNAIEN
ncbi:Rqc2 family fibronectin-binding protein [Virgibacillus sp. W0430]|uniref:Rqc2 family fibronectin-binding protein n=1 Tax=Virgibacillus sp. W0430 TaxID=3391580 RepID=UPI003F46A1F8